MVTCIVCGLGFEPRHPWMQRRRLLYATRDDSPRISATHRLDRNHKVRSSTAGKFLRCEIFPGALDDKHFRDHPLEVDEEPFYRACLSFPYGQITGYRPRRFLDFGHAYGGEIVPRPPSITSHCKVTGEAHAAFPENYSNVEEPTIFDILKIASSTTDRQETLALPGVGRDVFATLPPELLLMILGFLDWDDVVAFRQASRVAIFAPLGDEFFRARFYDGGEFEYVHEARQHFSDEPLRTKWRRVFLFCHKTRNRKTQKFQQKKRIFEVLQNTNKLIDKAMSGDCQGTPLWSHIKPSEPTIEIVNKFFQQQTVTRVLEQSSFRDHFCCGSRDIFGRKVIIPGDGVRVHVWTVELNGCIYVSGLGLESQSGVENLGYCSGEPDFALAFPTDDVPSDGPGCLPIVGLGIRLALDDKGIRGLALQTRHCVSEWVGTHADFAKKALLLGAEEFEGDRGMTLQATFDAFKIVSMAVSKHPGRPYSSGHRLDYEWLPDIPPPHLRIGATGLCSMIPRASRWMLFPGAEKPASQRLSRIRIWIARTRPGEHHGRSILAIEFSSRCDQLAFFGRRTADQWWSVDYDVFDMDPDANEVITKMSLRGVRAATSFTMHTSLHRECTFPHSWSTEKYTVETPESCDVVGFWASQDGMGYIFNFGFICELHASRHYHVDSDTWSDIRNLI
ncbi:uncharacterized protein E0L32_002347 [Thyridium curvatum]|uniref:F-box domain-containing protein n=1 Tax=Thyridium curvatum TaxID=1093900 RepID=A0A507APT5_9PEZI|nr:uncharacterized protein E0L32_002347 [Thyridium curvatum]TPX06851.1 hypothetical protein E0L32_002347 [Thyridium curvatum]